MHDHFKRHLRATNREKILFYTKKNPTPITLTKLKNKIYLYVSGKNNYTFPLCTNFNFIKTQKDASELVEIDFMIIDSIKQNDTSLMTEMLANVSKLKKLILVKDETNKSRLYLKNSKEILNRFRLKIFSKKKSLKIKKNSNFFGGKNYGTLITRRKNIPNFSISNLGKIAKIFSFNNNKKLGTLLKNKELFLVFISLDNFSFLGFSGKYTCKFDIMDNFQRISNELGLSTVSPGSLKTKDLLYIFSSFKI